MKKTNTSKTSIFTVAIFLAFIFLLSIFNIISPKKDFSENENRFLAKFPDSSLKNIFLGDFDTEFENYFSDQFILRDKWIEIKSNVLRSSGAIANNGVYFGKDGKLINQLINYDEKIAMNNIEYINEFASSTDTHHHNCTHLDPEHIHLVKVSPPYSPDTEYSSSHNH